MAFVKLTQRYLLLPSCLYHDIVRRKHSRRKRHTQARAKAVGSHFSSPTSSPRETYANVCIEHAPTTGQVLSQRSLTLKILTRALWGRWILLLLPFGKWENQGPESLNNFLLCRELASEPKLSGPTGCTPEHGAHCLSQVTPAFEMAITDPKPQLAGIPHHVILQQKVFHTHKLSRL